MTHSVEFKVRDYELDMQGVVNNGVYSNYFEHARHEYLLDKNVDFAELARQGINLVVSRIEIDYRKALTSGQVFQVETCAAQVSKLKFQFEQRLLNQDAELCAKAVVTGVAVNAKSGRPMRLEGLEQIFTQA
ncbi:acyl-CoA thioesterase [Agaribacterium haliotis]|uniref:acyl-CoA thioesterase n=1 Tax=Agaribacterium haliotis TaxID=2013869 RepID=UPI000BB58BB7|nr:thioesterase family protein [Agaribacterium haliotis]